MKKKLPLLPILGLSSAAICATITLPAQSFYSYPAGDDSTTSLGQFRVVLDTGLVDILDPILTNTPLAHLEGLPGVFIYDGGVFTSPVLFDGSTIIGRSAPFVSGAPPDAGGALAGQAPGRTYISDSQMTVRPTWGDATNGVNEIHTFIKSLNLTDLMSMGFSVKAGMQAPTRPVSAGEVEGSSPSSDFPANSFFDVFVQVDLPGGGRLPPIQLVNVDPLLVQHPGISSIPPKVVYQHGNSNAVSVYVNTDLKIPDPKGGPDIAMPRGTLFGQLTLAGHGIGYGEAEIASFETEIENELASSMPLNPTPLASVHIVDYSPNYNVVPPTLSSYHFNNGSFVFTVNNVTANTTNYVQLTTNLGLRNWLTIGTNVPSTNSFLFADPGATNSPQRFYRWMGTP
jgi:hypothetical protein